MRKDVTEFKQEIVLARGTALKYNRVNLLEGIINSKLERMVEEGKTLADSTKKDLVDLIMAQDQILKEIEKKDLGTTNDSVMVSIYQQLGVVK
jgi:hypothetical protein